MTAQLESLYRRVFVSYGVERPSLLHGVARMVSPFGVTVYVVRPTRQRQKENLARYWQTTGNYIQRAMLDYSKTHQGV